MFFTSRALLSLTSVFASVALQVAGQVSCDASATSPDDAWRSRMHDEIVDENSAVTEMIFGMCSLNHPYYDCNANGNTPNHCKYTVNTLSYNATFEMWSDSGRYLACDPSQHTNPANLINGFCISSHPPQQGSGYYRSPVDNYNLQLVANLPFVSCSGDDLPPGNPAGKISTLLQEVCGADACQEPEDKPECDRIVRDNPDYYVRLKAQNYGEGGTPHCGSAAGEIISRCIQDKGKRGGWWGIGGMQGKSQEYIEYQWFNEVFQNFEDIDETQ
ncbi:hypothetical protein CC78DRAFT_611316 [Lojkania enalia]|uniref:Uncharacterized protein n=1 Tax=Lojkania enalia TaxID=147567 RepID=A0A9P4TRG4_9PLEO|nr:hypothetical protein CC78DRAFT_611316 [Didymosphaeria enalia]